MSKLLSICIVSWNTKDLLGQCLRSVCADMEGIDAEIIVVDNASCDGSADMVEREFSNAMVIRNVDNLGFAAANNVGFRHSEGKYFLLLNSDTIVLPGAFKTLVDSIDASPEVGAVAPKLLNPDGSLQRSCSCFPSPLTEILDALWFSKLLPRNRFFGGYAMTHWDFNSWREVDFAGGSCLMVRREAMTQAGLLDEGYFMYTEEADLCYRLKLRDWKIMFVPDARVIHIGGQSSRLRPVEMAIQLPISRHRFVRKFRGPAGAAMFRVAVAIGGLCRIAVWTPMLFTANGRRSELKMRVETQQALLKWAVGGRP